MSHQDRRRIGAGDSLAQKEQAPRLAAKGARQTEQQDSDDTTPESKPQRVVHRTPADKMAALRQLVIDMPGSEGATQERRLLAALQLGPVTTFEASRYLDCYDPRPRVFYLRQKGHKILTLWVQATTEAGRTHRVGQYVLAKGA